MSVSSVCVVPDGKEWAVEEDGERVSTHYSQDEAEHFARDEAKREHAELLVYDGDGRVERKDSFREKDDSDSRRDESRSIRDDSRSAKHDEPRVIKR